MAECSLSGQTVVTGHYCLFTDTDGEKRFYALGSPPAVEEYAGTVQTTPCSVDAVAADIAAGGVGGVLVWSPRRIAGRDGAIFNPLEPVRIAITIPDGAEGDDAVAAVRAQIAAGGATNVSRLVELVTGERLNAVTEQDIWPPFAGLGFGA